MATQFKLKRSSVAGKRPALTNVQSGELALNTYDGSIFTQRDGVGLSTVTNLTPWYENYGAASIYYGNSVGIGTTNPLYDLDVRGSIGGYNDLRAPHRDTIVSYTVTVASKDATHRYQGQGSGNGYLIDGEFSPFLVLTPGRTYRFSQNDSSNNGHPIIFYLEADKTTEYTTGVSYFADGSRANSSAYNSAFNSASVKYTQIVVGDETPVVLHYQCYNHGYMGNSVQVNSNVLNTNYAGVIRNTLNVTGESTLASAIVSDLTDNRVVIAGTAGALEDSANLTFNGTTLSSVNINVSSTLDVDGLAEIDDLNVSAGSTFGGVVDVNHQIVGLATNNIIPFLFNNYSDLPSAVTYHGAFAHVHGMGKAYFAHAANWYEIVNKELNGTIGVGTERVNFGPSDITTLDVSGISTFAGNVDINANIDVNGTSTLVGFTTLGNNLFVAGVSTFANNITGTNATFSGNVSIGGTLTYEDVTNVDAIGIVTARSGIKVLGGGINVVGIATADGLDAIEIKDDGSSVTTGPISIIDFTGGNTITYNAGTRTVTVPVGSGSGSGTGGKFVENATGIHTLGNVGIGTTTASDKLTILGDLKLDGKLKVTNLGLSGSNGQFLKSTGVGVTWASFPTTRTSTTVTATANQTSFTFTYNVGFLDVFVNGSKLKSSDFTATNGTSVVLAVGAFVGDTVELISYNTTASGSGGGSGITDIVQDTTPQLGGNLDLNNKNITGTGDISITGDVTATSFSGNGSSLTNLNASNLASGTIPNGRFPSTLPALNGSNLTNLTAGNLTGALPAISGANLTGIDVFKTIAVSGQSSVVADSISDTLTLVAGSNMTITTNAAGDSITFASSGGGGGGTTDVGITTNITGSFTASAGSPSTLNTYAYNADDIMIEYSVFIKNGSNYQSQKVFAMRDGTSVDSTEYAIMFSNTKLAVFDVTRAGGNLLLRATPETGVNGNTTYRIKREVS